MLFKHLNMLKTSLWIIVAAMVIFLMRSVYFNPTISEVRGYYFTYPVLGYRVGNMVLICVWGQRRVKTMHQLKLPYVDNQCPYQTPYLIKRIVGGPGDEITVNANGIYINGALQINSQAQSEFKQIKLQPLAYGRFKLKVDEYFVLGISQYSYDSRYFGIVHKAQLYRQAVLIWRTESY